MAVSILRFRSGVDLPRRAYLDTNLLVYARDPLARKHRAATNCLGDLVEQGVELNVSTLVIDELWWSLVKLSYRQLTGLELTSREYKANADLWRDNWPTVRRITTEILAYPRFRILEPISSQSFVREQDLTIVKF